MSVLTAQQGPTASSGELLIPDEARLSDVEQKHQAVAELLKRRRFDAVLLQKPANVAWFTSGGDCLRAGSAETAAAVFVTPEARVIVATNADSAQVFERMVPGLGFQLKERPWHEPRQELLDDLCRGRTVASDNGFGHTQDASAELLGLRQPLSAVECDRARELGRQTAHAVEATARNCRPGRTEAELAGELAHRLIKSCVAPHHLQVLGDGKAARFPHWSYGEDRVRHFCTVAAAGRRAGLYVGAARTVCFGDPPQNLRNAHLRAALTQATGLFFSQPNWELSEVWSRVRRIYEKYGCPDDWRFAEQAEITGYDPCEVAVVPQCEFQLAAGMMAHWHPRVGGALLGDTMLVGEDGFEILTPMENWPALRVEVKGAPVERPDILRRPPEVT